MAIDDPRYPRGRERDRLAPHYAEGERPKTPPKPLPEIPNHRDRDRPFRTSMLKQLIAQANGDPAAIDVIAAQLIKLAKAGNIDAIKEVANRCDGQAPRVLAQHDGDVPMFLTVNWLAQPPARIEQVKVIDGQGQEGQADAAPARPKP